MRAYRRLSLKLHPDKPGGSNAKFQELSKAYKCLKDTLPSGGLRSSLRAIAESPWSGQPGAGSLGISVGKHESRVPRGRCASARPTKLRSTLTQVPPARRADGTRCRTLWSPRPRKVRRTRAGGLNSPQQGFCDLRECTTPQTVFFDPQLNRTVFV